MYLPRDRCENGSWFNHVLEWWEAAQADPEHVLFLHYEGLLKDPEGNIRKIAQFAGIEHTPETIAKVRDPKNPFRSRSSLIVVWCVC